jgi:hypothetical protein
MNPSKPPTGKAPAMPFVSSAGARAPRRGAAASFLVLFFVGSALSLVGASSASAAGVRTLYAYGGGGATSPTSCPKTTRASEKCTLAEALALSVAGSTVALATPGSKGHYIGNWTVSTRAFSPSAPVTLEPAPGVADPTLDGNQGKATNCQTKTCDGPVLTLASGVHMDLNGVTLQGADNTGRGGAIDNGGGGTLSVSACRFSDNRAVDGGAIDNGDRGGGVLTVSASTFSGNTATGDGGAIDNGDRGGGVLTVSASTFSGNTAGRDGGAIANADRGSGGLTVSASKFSGNKATDGGAVDNGDSGSGGLTVSASTFSANTAASDGGAIDNGDRGSGTLSVLISTFSRNTASDGGAINNAGNQGKGSLSVSASTFSGNRASHDGGAIDNGDNGSGSLSLWASTLSGNVANHDGGAIDNGDNGGTSVTSVAADIFNGSCDRPAGTWNDGGHNVGSNQTCLNAGTGDVGQGAAQLGPLADNGGPTKTIMALQGNPAVGVIPYETTTLLNGSTVKLCPTTDQRGVHSAAGRPCNAGATQSP